MADPRFYIEPSPIALGDLVKVAKIEVINKIDHRVIVKSVAPLHRAGDGDLAYCGSAKFVEALALSKATACLILAEFESKVPKGVLPVIVRDPERAFAQIGNYLYRQASSSTGVDVAANISSAARLEANVSIGPGAVIGHNVEIGENSVLGANVVVERGVTIGRNCQIDANSTLKFAQIGNGVRIQSNVSIGGDGFGYAMGAEGHVGIPQLGRVIIQDNVDVGSGTSIDRGAADDTIIGEGTKIDNLVQIGHNCVIGRHCIIAGKVGLAGSTTLGDFVVLGGDVGTAGHLTIGTGAQIAGKSGVTKDLPAGGIYAGFPAKPVSDWRREAASLARLARRKKK